MKARRIRRVTALGAATVAFSLVGCPEEPDDGILPDRDTIPEPRLEREPSPAAEPYGDVEPAPATAPAPPADEEGTFERAGERLDEAAEETGQELRQAPRRRATPPAAPASGSSRRPTSSRVATSDSRGPAVRRVTRLAP